MLRIKPGNIMSEIVIKIKDQLLASELRSVASQMGLSIDEVVTLAIRAFLTRAELELLERKYYELLEKVERMSLSLTTCSSAVIREYLKQLSEVKHRIEKHRRMLREAKTIEGLREVELGRKELEELGKLVLKSCDVVVFKDDIDPELLDSAVVGIYGVNTIKAPRSLYSVILSKAKLCGKVQVSE